MIKEENITEPIKKPRKEPKPKKEKTPAKTIKEVFLERVKTIQLEKIKRPWMAEKSFRLIDRIEDLQEWVETILGDPGRSHTLPWANYVGPVIAVDTETDGLDIRVINGRIKTQLAGVCLSADGIEGLYIPVGHEAEGSVNIAKADLAPVLQRLFDQSHLIFFNGKFDREILRLTLGLTFRDFPHFEDVQVLSYLHDPKAKVDPGAGGFQSGGLKATSKALLGIEQIELEELTKVRAKVFNEDLGKETYRMVYAPFTWVEPYLALWYAAGDAITTWLLWQKFWALEDFTKMSDVHRLDHQLIDTITWVERQRPRVDLAYLNKTIHFHENRVRELSKNLGRIAGVEDFNPGSTPQLRKILFEDRNMEVLGTSEKTGDASTSITVLKELQKKYPDDEFLSSLMNFREYAALHPSHLHYDKADNTARLYFKQNVVAGGRLAAAGGDFEKDGGCGMNPQAIKKVGGNWWVWGRLLDYPCQDTPPNVLVYEDASNLDPSCFNKDGKMAPNIHANNHTATYFDESYCMVPTCTTCSKSKPVMVDANEVINLRNSFIADPGWTMFCIDYSNIEMRVAANVSKEPAFIHEFLEGSGDFHSLTATALFPEFSAPGTPKGRTKELRSLAKIINFALLYGGTAYTIHENLNQAGFTMSFEEAEELVRKYWDSVPIFAAWCQVKRSVARAKLLCRTPTGRVIHFESAMEGYGIHEPHGDEKSNFFLYKKLGREESEYIKSGQNEEARSIRRSVDALWRDPESGVRNYQEYNRFLGKAERVSINIPLQGTAGDLMRSALNHIRLWVQTNPNIEKVFRLHLNVHDEIDFSVKNEFVPYILPRINRLMKLRSFCGKKGWPVPIETDCEYGQSWDVKYHLTGDKEHTASAWTEIPGLESYLPSEFEQGCITQAVNAWEEDSDKVKKWLRQCHPRTHHLIDKLEPQILSKGIRAILQLHEFWVVDEDEGDMMALDEYMEERGLEFPNEPLIGGLDSYLASIPLSGNDTDPILPLHPYPDLTPEKEDPTLVVAEKDVVLGETTVTKTEEEDLFYELPLVSKPINLSELKLPTVKLSEKTEFCREEDLFYELPLVSKPIDRPELKLPILRTIKLSEKAEFCRAVGLGAGEKSFSFIYEGDGKIRKLKNVHVESIPMEFRV